MRSVGLVWFTLFPGHAFVPRSMSVLGLPTKRRRPSAAPGTVKNEVHEDRASFTTRVKTSLDISSDGLWHDLCVPAEELRPAHTLTIGQCFNWRQAGGDCWVGVLDREVIAIRQTPSTTLFRSLGGVKEEDDDDSRAATASLAAKLRSYFFLKVPLAPLYQRWSEGDHRMAAVAACISGVRVLRQNPVECIFSFICSSNNNIPRITGMLEKLRRTYGDPLLSVGEGGLAASGALGELTVRILPRGPMVEECEEWAKQPLELHSFPTVEAVATRATEADLRAMGFGYRAKYIVESAKLIHAKGGEQWALDMRNNERDEVRSQLVTLCGVGPKVADCIALFSLDQASTIPVDVHVWRIACRDYDPSLLDCKSLTPTVYNRVGDLFRERFGDRAGWAHSLLFAAELPGFKAMLSPEMQEEMDEFKRQERDAKAESKAEKARVKEEKSSKSAKRAKQDQRGAPGRLRGRATRG